MGEIEGNGSVFFSNKYIRYNVNYSHVYGSFSQVIRAGMKLTVQRLILSSKEKKSFDVNGSLKLILIYNRRISSISIITPSIFHHVRCNDFH